MNEWTTNQIQHRAKEKHTQNWMKQTFVISKSWINRPVAEKCCMLIVIPSPIYPFYCKLISSCSVSQLLRCRSSSFLEGNKKTKKCACKILRNFDKILQMNKQRPKEMGGGRADFIVCGAVPRNILFIFEMFRTKLPLSLSGGNVTFLNKNSERLDTW